MTNYDIVFLNCFEPHVKAKIRSRVKKFVAWVGDSADDEILKRFDAINDDDFIVFVSATRTSDGGICFAVSEEHVVVDPGFVCVDIDPKASLVTINDDNIKSRIRSWPNVVWLGPCVIGLSLPTGEVYGFKHDGDFHASSGEVLDGPPFASIDEWVDHVREEWRCCAQEHLKGWSVESWGKIEGAVRLRDKEAA
jgi:hypothetical protein